LQVSCAIAQWPICYDQLAPDQCLQRNENGQEDAQRGLAIGACYHSSPWTVNSSLPSEPASNENPLGHESDLVKTLPMCSNEIRRDFQVQTDFVNVQCDYKTFLSVTHCGNCWIEICNFHNNLHWNGPVERQCAMDLFSRRMQCYSAWYNRYCGSRADGTPFLVENDQGVYPQCSSPAFKIRQPHTLAQLTLVVFTALLLNR